MDCTAAPLAPLPRLSRRAISSTWVSLANTKRSTRLVSLQACTSKKPAANLTATLVKQKIEKIEATGKGRPTRGVLSVFGRGFPGRKQSPKEEVDQLGFVAAGVEVEDY